MRRCSSWRGKRKRKGFEWRKKKGGRQNAKRVIIRSRWERNLADEVSVIGE